MDDRERDLLLNKIKILKEYNMDLEEYIDKRLKKVEDEIYKTVNKRLSGTR